MQAEREIIPVAAAGHSLGEYGALVAAGGLRFADAVRLVHLRGKFMQEAVPVGIGAMAAIMGLTGAEVEALCREAAQGRGALAGQLQLSRADRHRRTQPPPFSGPWTWCPNRREKKPYCCR